MSTNGWNVVFPLPRFRMNCLGSGNRWYRQPIPTTETTNFPYSLLFTFPFFRFSRQLSIGNHNCSILTYAWSLPHACRTSMPSGWCLHAILFDSDLIQQISLSDNADWLPYSSVTRKEFHLNTNLWYGNNDSTDHYQKLSDFAVRTEIQLQSMHFTNLASQPLNKIFPSSLVVCLNNALFLAIKIETAKRTMQKNTGTYCKPHSPASYVLVNSVFHNGLFEIWPKDMQDMFII